MSSTIIAKQPGFLSLQLVANEHIHEANGIIFNSCNLTGAITISKYKQHGTNTRWYMYLYCSHIYTNVYNKTDTTILVANQPCFYPVVNELCMKP